MEKIEGEYKRLIENCIRFASHFIFVPPTDLCFDNCPSDRFPTMNNSAESGLHCVNTEDGAYINGHMVFNKPWFLKSWNEHQMDLEFYVFHELRHLHQLLSIELLKQNQPTRDSYAEIQLWEKEFNGYKRNEGDGESQNANMAQEVELDANGYGLSLLMLYHIRDREFSFEHSLPESAYELADRRSQEYYKTKAELKAYIDQLGAVIVPDDSNQQ